MYDDILSLKREENFKSTEITEKQVYLHKKKTKDWRNGREGGKIKISDSENLDSVDVLFLTKLVSMPAMVT